MSETTTPKAVAVVGAHGKIGQLLARELAGRGYRVLGVHRKAEQVEAVEATGAVSVLHDLEADSAEHLAKALRVAADGEVAALVFTAGAGEGSGPARKTTVDLEGSTQSVDAARLAGIRRFVQVSFIGADREAEATGNESWDAYHRAKREADAALRATNLDWTVVRPGRLTDEPGTGRVRIGEELAMGDVSRADVAAVLAAVLEDASTVHRSFDLVEGDQPVTEALGGLGA